MRCAAPSRSSYCPDLSVQKNSATPTPPKTIAAIVSTKNASIAHRLAASRKAFSITIKEDADMATAAISGVTCPNAAKGTASAL